MRVGGQNRIAMPFRSHVARSLDLRLPSNLILVALILGAGSVALVLWLNGASGTLLWAPVHAFLAWGLIREIDPDHQWSAVVGALGAAGWVLAGGQLASPAAIGGLLLAGRIVVRSTGRCPLPTDLIVVGVFGVAIGYTIEGWMAGFGLAIAIHVDGSLDRDMATPNTLTAAVIAIGVTVVAAVFDAFPQPPLELEPVPTIVIGLAALIVILRDPGEPVSVVDARHGALIDGARLHRARSLTAILIFITTLLAGERATAFLPLTLIVALVIVSNELELLGRRGR